MSMSDTIADMLTRIRNAYAAKHKTVIMPGSNMKAGIADVLRKEGYIEGFKQESTDKGLSLEVTLRYSKTGEKVVKSISRVSKPSRRIYVGKDEIKKVKGGLGISILSTSKGIVSDRIARQQGIGGELLCTVW